MVLNVYAYRAYCDCFEGWSARGEQALHNYQYIASLDNDERIRHCKIVANIFLELTAFLRPDVTLTITEDGARPSTSELSCRLFLDRIARASVKRNVVLMACGTKTSFVT